MDQVHAAVARRRHSRRLALDFDALYRTLRVPVYAYLLDALRDVGAAEDLTSTTFERAYRRQATFDPRRGSERAWLFIIARSAMLDEIRVGDRRAGAASLDGEDPAHHDAVDPATSIAVRSAIMELGRFERELVALKFYAGLTNREIARVVNRSESSVGTMLHRILGRLREACDG